MEHGSDSTKYLLNKIFLYFLKPSRIIFQYI